MNVALVKIDVAAADLGRSVAQIFDLVDGGTTAEAGLLWIFNLSRSAHGSRRELRFWRPELQARAAGQSSACHSFQLGEVIGQILPARRESLHAGEVDQLFQIRPRTRLDFGGELPGRLVGCRNVYSRPALATFLQRRWLGKGGGK